MMSRRGQGKELADKTLFDSLCQIGVSATEAQRMLGHPMAAKEIAYAFKGLSHRYDTVTMMTQAARVLSPAEIASCFAAGVGEDVSVSSWLDRPLQPFEQSGRPLKFLAKRYKEAAIQSGDILKEFLDIGFYPATLSQGCAYLKWWFSELREGRATEIKRDIVLLGSMTSLSSNPLVPYLVVPSAPAENKPEYRLASESLKRTWGMGEWFLFVGPPD